MSFFSRVNLSAIGLVDKVGNNFLSAEGLGLKTEAHFMVVAAE